MTVDATSSRIQTVYTDDSSTNDAQEPTRAVARPVEVRMREPERIELPIGAFGPHVTTATVLKDLGEVEHHLARVESDLKSEKLRTLATKDKNLYEASVKANVTAASLFATIYMFKERGLQVTAVLALVSKFVDLTKTLQPFQDFVAADGEMRKAAVVAHPDVMALTNDLLATGRSVLKLAGDTIRATM